MSWFEIEKCVKWSAEMSKSNHTLEMLKRKREMRKWNQEMLEWNQEVFKWNLKKVTSEKCLLKLRNVWTEKWTFWTIVDFETNHRILDHFVRLVALALPFFPSFDLEFLLGMWKNEVPSPNFFVMVQCDLQQHSQHILIFINYRRFVLILCLSFLAHAHLA